MGAAKEPKTDQVEEAENAGKKTFAGRRPPTKDPFAQSRFLALKISFEKMVKPRVATQQSYLEARLENNSSKIHCCRTHQLFTKKSSLGFCFQVQKLGKQTFRFQTFTKLAV